MIFNVFYPKYTSDIYSNHGSLLFRLLLFLANVTLTKICQANKNLDETHLVGGVEDICHTELAPKHHTRNMENKMIWKTVWFSSNMDRMMGVIACCIHSCTNMYPLFLLFLFMVLSPDFWFVLHKTVMLWKNLTRSYYNVMKFALLENCGTNK